MAEALIKRAHRAERYTIASFAPETKLQSSNAMFCRNFALGAAHTPYCLGNSGGSPLHS